MQKRKRENKKYCFEHKLRVILDMRENNLGYRETVRKYWGAGVVETNHIAHLKQWERIYLEEGVEGLMKERRGRATKADNPKIGRPEKLEKSVEEDLIKENQRLRMENEYLKKLAALILEEEENERKRKQK